MKLISLNCYGGIVYDALIDFVRFHATDTDVFCFQEVQSALEENIPFISNKARTNLLQEFQALLPNHQVVFTSMQDNFDTATLVDLPITHGIAMFVHKDYAILETGETFISNEKNSFAPPDYGTMGCAAQFATIQSPNGGTTICNLHGNSEPGNKLDTPDRLAQSQKILDLLDDAQGPHVIMGDFNLYPNTKSIQMFEEAGYRNLIREFGITETRGSYMRKLHPEFGIPPSAFQTYADFTFTSPELRVISFEVPDVPISDHLPMILTLA